MFRIWLTRRWLLATLVAIGFAIACFYLGRWQWHRHVEQRTKVEAIANNYGAAPRPLTDVPDLGALTPEQQWTRVTFSGTYAVGSDILVRNRAYADTVGFEVLTPLTTDGRTLLVDRGWVPSAVNAETAPPADPPPNGTVAVTGWLRTGEPSLGRLLPPPQLSSISISEARRLQPSVDPVDSYVVLGAQQPAAAAGSHPVTVLQRPEEDLGPHQAYAYQWWLFMPGGLVFIFWAIRHEWEMRRAEDPVRALEHVRAKKVRIWDEEDA
ncbi:MAG: SURF1 family protein [Terracoccus sp.]